MTEKPPSDASPPHGEAGTPPGEAGTPPSDQQVHPEDERPPILGRWSVLYALVIGALAVQAVLYFLLTRAYSP